MQREGRHVAVLGVEVRRIDEGGQHGWRAEGRTVVVAGGTCWDEEALCLQSHWQWERWR